MVVVLTLMLGSLLQHVVVSLLPDAPIKLLNQKPILFRAYLPNNKKKMKNQILGERVERDRKRKQERGGDFGQLVYLFFWRGFWLVSVFVFFSCIQGAISLLFIAIFCYKNNSIHVYKFRYFWFDQIVKKQIKEKN